MDFTNEVFSLSRIRETDLAYLLEMLGHKPSARRKNDTDWWYLSPLRNERTPSFHIDCMTNEWYDFGLMAGSNPVDFLLRYHRCSITELPERMNVSFFPNQLPFFERGFNEGRAGSGSKLLVKDVRPLYAYPLKNYLHERSIPIAVAEALKKEINGYQELPVVRQINNGIVQRNYLQIKDVQEIIQLEMERLLSDPALMHLIIKK